MEVRDMKNIDTLARWLRNNRSLWWLGTEILAFVNLDSRRCVTYILFCRQLDLLRYGSASTNPAIVAICLEISCLLAHLREADILNYL